MGVSQLVPSEGSVVSGRPLSRGLGPQWRWLHDPTRLVTTLLHPSGLHVHVSDDAIESMPDALADTVSAALAVAASRGVTGEARVIVNKTDDGFSARVEAA